jgi:hypothetical protein
LVTPVILATQEAVIRFEASLDKKFMRPYLEKTITKKRADGVAQGRGPEFNS